MSEKTGWIDFHALRKSVSFPQVLKLYNIELRVKGDQAQGFCPLPGHKGQRRSPSFSVNLGKGIFQCFGCGAKGNVLDFVARIEGLDPFKGKDIRRAAEILQEKLGLAKGNAFQPGKKSGQHRSEASTTSTPPRTDLPVVINAPLDFELKDLDPEHPYLLERGFTAEAITHFGLGYCNRGLFKQRVVIPIDNDQGQLVAYAGRATDDRAISEKNPKYKLPAAREREGKRYEFHKSLLLYNAHRIPKRVSDIIIVEGFPSVWWLWQHGYHAVIALMGSDCSDEQAKLILERVDVDGRIWIMTDGDDAGERCAAICFNRLAPYRFVKWVKLKDGEQPTDCSLEELKSMLSV